MAGHLTPLGALTIGPQDGGTSGGTAPRVLCDSSGISPFLKECSEDEDGYSSGEAENEDDEDDTEEAEEDEDEEEEMLLPGMEGKEEVRTLVMCSAV